MPQRNSRDRPEIGIILVLACLALSAFAAPAQAAEHGLWMVARVQGDVSHGEGNGSWRVALAGDRLPTGRHVRTGVDGRLTMIRGRDRVDAGPNAHFVISDSAVAARDGIVQRLGRMLFDMGERDSRNFGVDTPLLAVVIKGTRFSVEVSAETVEVHVEDGLVEVVAKQSGESALVEPGFTASVTAADGGLDIQSTDASSGAGDTIGQVTDSASGLIESIGDTATDAVGGAADSVGGAAESVGGSAGGVGDSVGGLGGAVGGLGDSVGGVTGGL